MWPLPLQASFNLKSESLIFSSPHSLFPYSPSLMTPYPDSTQIHPQTLLLHGLPRLLQCTEIALFPAIPTVKNCLTIWE